MGPVGGRGTNVKSYLIACLAAVLPGGLAIAQSAPADAAKSAYETNPKGWTNIMPRADLKGWSRVTVPPGGQLGKAQWHTEDRGKLLVCDGDGGHDMFLCTREFGDAIFHVEFRYTKVEGKSGYNSGIYARNNADGSIWHQCQIGDASGGYLFGETPGADGKKRFFSLTGDVKEPRVKPAGEWNTVEITAKGAVMTLWVNGAATCELRDCGQPKGLVGLEGEGFRIEFRNLKVKELKERG